MPQERLSDLALIGLSIKNELARIINVGKMIDVLSEQMARKTMMQYARAIFQLQQ